MARLKIGSTVQTVDGDVIKIKEELGEGGQGVVYKVDWKGKPYALKWYRKGVGDQPKAFYHNLCENVKRLDKMPKTFLWPKAVTTIDEKGCFGYVMDLRPKEYKEFSQFLLNRARFENGFESLINAALQIIISFRALHNAGLSYQDLNDGNFFINPKTGDVLICDNDNVAPNGDNLGIKGKPRYMAPEVVLNEKKPDTYTDRFSLAVVLFLLLYKNHPLSGMADKDGDDPAKNERRLYAENPVFIYDPKKSTNRPNPAIHKNVIKLWPVYPKYIQDLFIRAFSEKLMHCDEAGRQNRLLEKEWQKNFLRLRNELIRCSQCGEEVFGVVNSPKQICFNCSKTFGLPAVLSVREHKIVLYPGKKIFHYHIDEDDATTDNMNQVVAEVIQNKKNPKMWGLKNLSSKTWYKQTPGGKEDLISRDGVVPIARGIKLNFGTTASQATIE